ncbi:hypothetical protein CVD28_24430 [Bacillus sp. M6-12]|uniref:OmpL47-type beta-barrel domain-containing protein n=1 Tax=Bacillus sp. M6-12 TaxID=2054166 RepID=UPI000C77B141|nr:hypothetical protein [Bacillus sp. M6-12]PLS15030.1 hypothetical protein CVD28_24430 [Bacillus sp. M6-12]
MSKKKKTSKQLVAGMVSLALISSSNVYTPKAYASGEDELQLKLSSKANIDIVLTTNETDVDMNRYQTALKDKLIEKGIGSNRINITGVEGYKTQTALVLQDAEAWDSREVVIDTLRNLGYTPEVKTSSQLPSLDLYRYSHIFITSDQPQSFYTVLNQNMNRITDWIRGGGILQFNAADQGWRSSFWTNGPAGIEHISNYDGTNYVVIPNHAVTQGIPSTVTGSYASHSYLTNLPQGTIVYMSNSAGRPTVAEFNYGIGTIFVQTTTAEYYTTHSGNLAPLLRNTINYNIKKILTKSFNDIIKQPKWNDGSERFIVNVDDDKVADFDSSTALGEILPRVINEELHYVGLGTNTNKDQTNSFIRKINNEGAFFDNNNFEDSINKTADYIISQLNEQETGDSQYVLVGEPIDISVTPTSLATNTQTAEYPLGRWRIDHNYNYFENSLGQASWANQWQKDLQMVFDKPGQYDISFGDKHPNPRYVYAHRRPVASFSSIVRNNGSNFAITIQDYSYDLDMESRTDKGIAEYEWKWKKTTDSDWTIGKVPSSLPLGNDYIVQLRVKDHQGVWSSPESRYITTSSVVAKPVANFTIDAHTKSMYETLDISDTSYDPAGRNVTEKSWTVYKNNTQIYSGSTPLTNFRNYGVGEYRIALKVKNDANLWSEEFSRNIIITDDKENPEAIVNPTSQSWTSNNVNVNIKFSDKGGSGFKHQRYAVTQSSTPPASNSGSWSAYSSATDINVTVSQEGKNYIHIEGEDNAGNKFTRTIGEYQIDKTAPNVTHSFSPSTWQKDKVTINLNANDALNGIRSIELPNGNKVYDMNAVSYLVEENGNYTFKVTDNSGNVATKVVSVTTIDKTAPAISHSLSTSGLTEGNVRVNMTASDSQSGVKSITLPDGTVINGGTASFVANRNGKYEVKAEDNVGNKKTYELTVSNITFKPELTATPVPEEDYVHLNWTMADAWQGYKYMIYKKKSTESSYQSIPAKSNVKVLNVYPRTDATTTFTGWNGESKTIPISSSIEKWMEQPNGEHAKGYGQGLIDVDTVSIPEFNANPNAYLKNPDGSWKYDVVFEGALDGNGFRAEDDYSPQAVSALKSWIADGQGYLSGHDTIMYPMVWNTNANQLRDDLNMKVSTLDPVANGVGSTGGSSGTVTVKVKNKGFLTNYPWSIGDVNTILTVPASHNTGQVTYGNVWMDYTNFSGRMTDINGQGSANFYLSTWNNTAMIQTGHSNGQATPDEQKVLANTLFYLAQKTQSTSWDDHTSQDVDAPNKPVIQTVVADGLNNKVKVDFTPVSDNGSTYDYYVEATGQQNGAKTTSDTETATITTGLDGYSYVIDNNPTTVPDKTIDTRNASFTMNKDIDSNFYVHVVAIDKVGNMSEVSHYHYVDSGAPTLNVVADQTAWTKGNVVLTATASDKETAVKRIKLPNGTWINGENSTYTVTQNGTYMFVAEDLVGNQTTKTITVSNIDKSAPSSPSIANNQDWINASSVAVSIQAGTDSLSGVNRVEYKLEGATIKGWTKYTGTFQIVNEGETKIIARTIDNVGQISGEDTSYVRIDRSVPHNTGITIKLKP